MKRKYPKYQKGRFIPPVDDIASVDNTKTVPLNVKRPLTPLEQANIAAKFHTPTIGPSKPKTLIEQQENQKKLERLQQEYVDGKPYASIKDGRIVIDYDLQKKMEGVDNLSRNLETASIIQGAGELGALGLRGLARTIPRGTSRTLPTSTQSIIKQYENPFYYTNESGELVPKTMRVDNQGYVPPETNPALKPYLESEINWGAWNKEIPENKPLLEEYNNIERITKQNGTWMKNPDGSEFKGTPEQFVQQNSSNFKKAFPIGFEKGYRGDMTGDVHLTGDVGDNRVIFTADKETGQHYAGKKGKLFELYNPKSTNSLSFDNKGRSWRTISREHFGDNPPNLDNLSQRLNTPQTGNYTSTDDIADWIKKNNKDYVDIKNIFDGTDAEFVKMINHKKGNYLKSAIGNNGMFDMTNPNIYKALVPAIAGAATLNNKQYGGNININPEGLFEENNPVIIPSNKITMRNQKGKRRLPNKVLAIPNNDNPIIMENGQDYYFPNSSNVLEIPMFQGGGTSFNQQWMRSPMYNKMLTKSAGSIAAPLISATRAGMLAGSTLTELPPYSIDRGSGVTFTSNTGHMIPQIQIAPDEFHSKDYLMAHEQSHASDYNGVFIPIADVKKIKKYAGNSVTDTNQYKEDLEFFPEAFKDENYFPRLEHRRQYISDPSETRARLNAIRAAGKKAGIYDPFTQPITVDQLLRIEDKGLSDLLEIYDYDEIVDMLNTISKKGDNTPLTTAKKGGIQKYSKGAWVTNGNPYERLPEVLENIDKGGLTNEEAGSYFREWRTTPEGQKYITNSKQYSTVFGPANSPLGMYDNTNNAFFRFDDKEGARAKVNQADTLLNQSREELKEYLTQRGFNPQRIFRKGGNKPCYNCGGTKKYQIGGNFVTSNSNFNTAFNYNPQNPIISPSQFHGVLGSDENPQFDIAKLFPNNTIPQDALTPAEDYKAPILNSQNAKQIDNQPLNYEYNPAQIAANMRWTRMGLTGLSNQVAKQREWESLINNNSKRRWDNIQQIDNDIQDGQLYGYKQYQTGGQYKPIVVNNPNDPRLRAYQDSLTLSRNSEKTLNTFNKLGWDNNIDYSNWYSVRDASNNPQAEAAAARLTKLNKKVPTPQNVRKVNIYGVEGKDITTGYINDFKAPVQPVIYKKPAPKPKTPAQQTRVFTDKAEFDKANRAYSDSLDLYKRGLSIAEKDMKAEGFNSFNPNVDFNSHDRETSKEHINYILGSKESYVDGAKQLAKDALKRKILPIGDYASYGRMAFKKPVQKPIYQAPAPTINPASFLYPEQIQEVGVPIEQQLPAPVQTPLTYKDFGANPYYRANKYAGTPVLLSDGRVQMQLDGKLIGQPIDRGVFNQYATTDRDNLKLEELMKFQRGGIKKQLFDFINEDDEEQVQSENYENTAPSEQEVIEEQIDNTAELENEEYNAMIQMVLASSDDEDFNSENIPSYVTQTQLPETNQAVNQPTNQGKKARLTPKGGTQQMQYAFNYLQEKGIAPHIAAGIVGNFRQESDVRPDVGGDEDKNGNPTSFGIAQWHNERWTNLVRTANKRGVNPYDLNFQLDYAIEEAEKTGVMKHMQKAKNSEEAAYIWADKFENPKVIDKNRAMYAKQLFKKGGTYDLSEAEVLNLINQGYNITTL